MTNVKPNRLCHIRCGEPVVGDPHMVCDGYSYWCPNCDEDLYTFETETAQGLEEWKLSYAQG